MKRILVLLILFLPVLLNAQIKLTGTAYDADNRSKLKLVFVNNLTQKEVDHTGQKGDFTVIAELGDLIVFSCPGYQSDTLIVEDLSPKMVIMRLRIIVLDEVVVTALATSKPEDLKRSYSSAYSYASTNVLSTDGKLSLANAFSKQAQQKRAFQKFIDSELNERLIDQKFNKQLVAQLTKVQGQLLDDFMSYFRPTYSMVSTLNDVDLRTYIIESYNKYIRLPAEERIYPPLPKTSFGGR